MQNNRPPSRISSAIVALAMCMLLLAGCGGGSDGGGTSQSASSGVLPATGVPTVPTATPVPGTVHTQLPSGTPVPTTTPTVTPTPAPAGSPTPVASPNPMATPTPVPSPTAAPTRLPSPTPGTTPVPTVPPTVAPTPVPNACTTVPPIFTSSVGASIGSICSACHVAGGLASGTRLVFGPGGATTGNYGVVANFVENVGGSTLLGKTVGLPSHSGGAPYVDTNSQNYKNLQSLVATIQQNCTTGPVTTGPSADAFWQGVTFTDTNTALARAAVLFAGRNPSAAEVSAVAAGGDAVLRQTIRGYMQGAAFDRFLTDAADTQFLTPGVVVFGTGGLNATDFPTAALVLAKDASIPTTVVSRFRTSVRREPIELLKYIVNNDKPWTDMVAGNYTVSNGLLAQYLNAQVQGTFVNAADDNEWRTAQIPNQRLGGMREHSGVLSTHAWLSRFPTTPTNRNRHRVNTMMMQFLATDITALGMRPLNTGGSAFKVPTVENPACAMCHDTMDPIAAGFQNWNEENRYLPVKSASGKDIALPASYRSGSYPKDANGKAYYQDGDNWFRDDKAPGYGATAMPGGVSGNPTALQWTGGQVAADPRYGLGAVYFWYEAMFGRKPLRAPGDSSSPDYATQLAAFNAQNKELTAIAASFATNRGKGAWNVKDLLTDLAVSKWFRADRIASLPSNRLQELADVGSVNLLLPTQLNLKLLGTVGQSWDQFTDPYTGAAPNYTDFDGNTRTVRAKAYTMIQAVTIERLVDSRSCNIAKTDFDKPAVSRLLFPYVELSATPDKQAGSDAILKNIQYLHKWLLKEDLAVTDAEIQRTLKLFTDVWNDRTATAGEQVACEYNDGNDPTFTGRAWASVIGYLIGDPKFLYE